MINLSFSMKKTYFKKAYYLDNDYSTLIIIFRY